MLEQAVQDGGIVTTGRQVSSPACSLSRLTHPRGRRQPKPVQAPSTRVHETLTAGPFDC